ncbi:MAG: hypothetical protein IKN59_08130 [Paludibacteraceae bacterium]|nr:hypothetical protein [Paludibacteraceae bacterium]
MNKKKLIVLVLGLLAGLTCFAEDYGEENKVDGLLSKVMDRVEAKSRYIPTINGAIQMGYQLNADPNIANSTNSFIFNTARLNVKGNPLDWFHYNIQVDFANKVRVLDFNLNFHPLANTKAKSQYINIWLGQSKTPLTLESPLGPADFEVVDYSQVVNALCGYSQALTPELTNVAGGRDIGLAVYGYALRVDWGGATHDFFDYKLGVYNGSGMNCLDKDKMKDVSGALYVHPLPELTVGGSFYLGAYNMKVNTGTDTVQMQTRRDRWAASFRYDDKAHWLARAEYVGGKTHGRYSDGWYAMLQYTINPAKEIKNQWAVVAKYDAYRNSYKLLPDYCNHQILAGVNYRPMRWLYVQALYTYRMDWAMHKLSAQHHQAQVTVCLIY